MHWKTAETTPRPPFIARYPDGDHDELVVSINYDPATGALATVGTTRRSPGCHWSTFVTYPGTPQQCQIPARVGRGAFWPAALNVLTLDELHQAGFTAIR